MKPSSILLCFALFVTISCATQQQSQNNESADIRTAVTTQKYTFKARSVEPTRARSRQLTSEYDLRVSKDTIIAYLPYFGRAYSAPMDPGAGGIKFTSVNFDYSLTEREKGGWKIQIKPNDVRDVQQLFLTISDDGYGSLQVLSNNRQPISYSGYIGGGK